MTPVHRQNICLINKWQVLLLLLWRATLRRPSNALLYKLRRELLDLARLWLIASGEPIILIDDAKERTKRLV